LVESEFELVRNVCNSLCVAVSQSLTVSSSQAVSTWRPSGEKATDQTLLKSPRNSPRRSPLARSERMAEFSLPVNTFRPSGETAMDSTQSPSTSNLRMSFPSAMFQIQALLLLVPANRRRPSAEKATQLTSA